MEVVTEHNWTLTAAKLKGDLHYNDKKSLFFPLTSDFSCLTKSRCWAIAQFQQPIAAERVDAIVLYPAKLKIALKERNANVFKTENLHSSAEWSIKLAQPHNFYSSL